MNESGLVLDLERHEYRHDGIVVPGVSTIAKLGNEDAARFFTAGGRERGTAVHRAMELLVKGQLDWASVDERIIGWVRAGALWLSDQQVVIDETSIIERPLWHPIYRYAGMPDLIVKVRRWPAVVDWKTGELGRAALTTAGYAELARVNGVPTRRRLGIQLREDGTYKQTEYTDPWDLRDFLAMLQVGHRLGKLKELDSDGKQ